MKLKGLLNKLDLSTKLEIYPQCEKDINPLLLDEFTFHGEMGALTHAKYENLCDKKVGDIISISADGTLVIPVDCSFLDERFGVKDNE